MSARRIEGVGGCHCCSSQNRPNTSKGLSQAEGGIILTINFRDAVWHGLIGTLVVARILRAMP
jgi:hypothetical protein